MNRQDKAGNLVENCLIFYIICCQLTARVIDNCDVDRFFLHLINFFYSKMYFLPLFTWRHKIHCYVLAYIHGGINVRRLKIHGVVNSVEAYSQGA